MEQRVRENQGAVWQGAGTHEEKNGGGSSPPVLASASASPFSDLAARSCLIMYRMGGLRHALLYLLDLLRQVLPVERLNALYCARDLSSFIAMADTSAAGVSSKYSFAGKTPPILLGDRLGESLIIDDLTPYKRDELMADPDTADIPLLHYQSVLRVALFESEGYIFVVNCWAARTGAFRREDREGVLRLLRPLATELKVSLSGINVFHPSQAPASWLSGREKLALCPGLAGTLRLAEHAAATDGAVLILGETGVGKEGVADVIHELSPRRDGPFIKVNCGAIPESLLDSELFGHEKGAFTGAISTRPGYFEQADGGTIFLDEIGEMSPSAQVRLLRVLDSGCVMRVGASRAVPLDVRIIAATHDDLPRRVVAGAFRKDLWYRLSVFVVEVPPLRRRPGDIPPLVAHFARTKARKLRLPYAPHIAEKELAGLFNYDWPGNVRELEHVVERALLKNSMEAKKRALHFEIMRLPGEDGKTRLDERAERTEWPTLREWENRYIREALEHCGGKLTGAGSATALLDIHYTTLRARMRQMGLPVSGPHRAKEA